MSQSETDISLEDDISVQTSAPTSSKCSKLISVFNKMYPFMSCCLLFLSSCSALIILPVYIQRITAFSHVYSALLLTSCLNPFLLVGFFLLGRYLINPDAVIHPNLGWIKTFIVSLLLGLCGLLFFYSREKNKVLCHIQDPLWILALPLTIFLYFALHLNALSTRVLLFSLLVLIGIFIPCDYQFCNQYTCRGLEITNPSQDGGPWSSEQHGLWTALYIVSIIIWCCFWALIDKFMCGSNKHGINGDVSHADSDEAPLLQGNMQLTSFSYIEMITQAFWALLGSALVILLSGWTPLVIDEKEYTFSDLMLKLLGGLYCHFKQDNECHNIMPWAWAFKISACCLVVSHFLVMRELKSAVLVTCISSLSLLVTSIFWSLFTMMPNEVVWNPVTNVSITYNVIGCIITLIGVICLFWHHNKTVVSDSGSS